MTDENPEDERENTPASEVNTSAYWDAIYREEESPGWNLGAATPPLLHWLGLGQKPGRVLVPACGYGHDARAFAAHGFDALGVDFAPLAIERARAVETDSAEKLEFREADIFALAETEAAGFDWLFEHTCFAAIHPSRREEYAELTAKLLKPGGRLIGCFYNHKRPGGPPYDVTREEVVKIFSPHFKIQKFEVTGHSIERRAGAELWAEFVRQ